MYLDITDVDSVCYALMRISSLIVDDIEVDTQIWFEVVSQQ